MKRGPVGSLASPENVQEFARFEDRGAVIFVHRDLLPGATGSTRLLFYFGLKGQCRLEFQQPALGEGP